MLQYYPFGDTNQDYNSNSYKEEIKQVDEYEEDSKNNNEFPPPDPWEKWLFHVWRYRNPETIISQDKSFLPIHTMDAELEKPWDEVESGNRVREKKKEEVNQEEKDVMINLGDQAWYFTINKKPTIL